jgi:hypothetical protein
MKDYIMNKVIKKKNDIALKLRCENLLNSKDDEKPIEWRKKYFYPGIGGLYTAIYTVKLENGQSYPTIVQLGSFSFNNKCNYTLAFGDMPSQGINNQNYKPLRQLGKLVFNR